MDAMWSHILIQAIVAVVGAQDSISNGVFWQISDFHYDSNYSVQGDPMKMCHVPGTPGVGSSALGNLGDYRCDAPLSLIRSAIRAMKTINSDPDFILWTGDSVPHVGLKDISEQKIYDVIKTVTQEMRSVFPNATIYPIFGNHDPYPSNMMPFKVSKYYEMVANYSGWNSLLSKDMMSSFLKGGYYTTLLKIGLRLVALNTPLYYHSDSLTKDIPDPAGQFEWLKKVLDSARKQKERIFLVAHVPPGMFGRVRSIGWFYPQFNKRYVTMLNEYDDIIKAQFYGHEHTDGFRVVYNDKGTATGSMFLSPAVTPWNSTLAGAGYNNPSVRLYTYNRDSTVVTDYIQYYLNLTEANAKPNTTWQIEYQFTKAYGVPDADVQSMAKVVQHLNAPDETMLRKYNLYNSVSADIGAKCNDTCKINHICAITSVDYDAYDDCLKKSEEHVTTQAQTPSRKFTPTENSHKSTSHRNHHRRDRPFPHYMYYIIGGLGATMIVLFIVIAVLCLRRRQLMGQPRYMRSALTIN